MTTTTASASLPIISLASSHLSRQLLQVLSASASPSSQIPTGFFYLTEHHIPTETLGGAFEASRSFFEEETQQNKIKTIDRQGHTGWTGVGQESLDATKAVAEADVKESFYLSLSILPSPPSSQCAPQLLPPTLSSRKENYLALTSFAQHCRRVCEMLLDAFERALQLQEGSFKDRHRGGEDDRIRLIRYPAQHPGSDGHESYSGIRAGAHSDYGSLTLLAQSDVGGLQVRGQASPADQEVWIDVPPREGALVVNVGDCLEFWSRGLLPSTVHRVVEPRVDAEREARYSIAYFHHPSPTSTLTPISPSLLPNDLVNRLPSFAEWSRNCLLKGIPPEALPQADGCEVHAMTGGEYLKRRLKGSGL